MKSSCRIEKCDGATSMLQNVDGALLQRSNLQYRRHLPITLANFVAETEKFGGMLSSSTVDFAGTD
ncbi:hypothetical protein [Noviherbaspirillum humi]|uniref:hypothetical protein n=1 Tax=Noviherbaspirillum humi TaxID=1688639 RepID=UPI0011601CFB|nr:hypothetical protein [Noviherbaspirillum humi]